MSREFSLSRLVCRLVGMAGMLALMLAVAGAGVTAAQWAAWMASSPGSGARRACTETQLEQFRDAVQLYTKDNGRPPSTGQGLYALVRVPALEPRPKHWKKRIPDLEQIPNDPWDHPYVYQSPGPHGEAFLITSFGADGRPGGTGWNRDSTSGPTDGTRNGGQH